MTKAVNLARHLTEQIESGRYPVGSTIPTEAELQERFEVSRHTVREALRDLKARGVLMARAGVGTVVREQAPGMRFIHGVGTLEDVIQFGEATRMKVMARADVVADAALAGQVGAREGQELHRIDLLRFRPDDALPAGYLHMYLRPEHAELAKSIESSGEPVVRLIDRRFGIRTAEIVQHIVAASLNAAQARILETRPGKPALYVTRRHRDAHDRFLLATVGLYPSDRFSHNTRFRIQPEA
jgi:DNA-binding GntR family transcriptional regulator